MKPLSSVSFIKGNIKRVLPIFISTILCVFLIYLFSLLITSDVTMGDKLGVNIVKNNSVLYAKNPYEETISEELISEIENNENVETVIPVYYDNNILKFKGIIANNMISFVNVFEEDLDTIMKKWNLELIEGTLPKDNKREVILPEEFARANNVKVGEILKKSIDSNKYLYSDYKVVGIFNGRVLAPITCYVDGLSREKAKKSGLIYFFKNNEDLSLNDTISRKISDNLELINYKEMKGLVDKGYSGLWALYYAFSIIITIIVAISLSNLNHLSFLHRMDEFKLYYSIGFTKKSLRVKVLKENALVALFGAIAGMIFTITVSLITNILIFESKGQELLLYSIEGIILVATVIIIVPLLSSVSTFRAIGRSEYID